MQKTTFKTYYEGGFITCLYVNGKTYKCKRIGMTYTKIQEFQAQAALEEEYRRKLENEN